MIGSVSGESLMEEATLAQFEERKEEIFSEVAELEHSGLVLIGQAIRKIISEYIKMIPLLSHQDPKFWEILRSIKELNDQRTNSSTEKFEVKYAINETLRLISCEQSSFEYDDIIAFTKGYKALSEVLYKALWDAYEFGDDGFGDTVDSFAFLYGEAKVTEVLQAWYKYSEVKSVVPERDYFPELYIRSTLDNKLVEWFLIEGQCKRNSSKEYVPFSERSQDEKDADLALSYPRE